MGLCQLAGITLGTERAPTLQFPFLLTHIDRSILSVLIFQVSPLLQFVLYPQDPQSNQSQSLRAGNSQFNGDNPRAGGKEMDAQWDASIHHPWWG